MPRVAKSFKNSVSKLRKSVSDTLVLGMGTFFVLHSIRDLLQYLKVDNFITQIFHESGIRNSNKLLSLVGAEYSPDQEIFYFSIFLIIGLLLIKYGIKRTHRY